MKLRDVALTGPLRWHLQLAADPGTDPLVVRPLPIQGLEVIRAVAGEEPSATERRRIQRIVARHHRLPLQLPAEVGSFKDWVLEVDDDRAPAHRSLGSGEGYRTREAAEYRVEQLRAIYARRGQAPPLMRVVARPRRAP